MSSTNVAASAVSPASKWRSNEEVVVMVIHGGGGGSVFDVYKF